MAVAAEAPAVAPSLDEVRGLALAVERAVVLAHGRVLHDGPPPTADHVHLHDPEHAHPAHAVVERNRWTVH